MTRTRLAVVLGVVATLAVLTTTGAVATYLRAGEGGRAVPAAPLRVEDPGSGAWLEVPAAGWRVRPADRRIYYEDGEGRTVAEVRGPAVFREGYCEAEPRGSYRAFAGFTRQSWGAWLDGLTGGGGAWSTGTTREDVTLADGTRARVRRTGLLAAARGRCPASGIVLAMVRVGEVRAVVVADAPEADSLEPDEVVRILATLRAS
ncbi:hypothetical protein [Nocardioides soli]|uniref:DUF8017 domain-containing protein n=1 Tax=Nocardioides soli TaxID=1036020 RepID=A0A7W4Z064_9ACTN|nr:hypothetical protein [Nocardioides soli]MBB3041989.1 hypothetical protein [Nocardioides soli]